MKSSCCFIGHREIKVTEILKLELNKLIINLISNARVTTFLFGSKSKFDTLCYEVIRKIKEDYPHIRRIYVRSMYEDISDSYEEYLLSLYEETYIPKSVVNSGKLSYIKRNQYMIDMSDYCVFFYDVSYEPPNRRNKSKSGTKIAYEYAVSKKKKIINVCLR